jgi:hypothetical protein
MRSHGRLQLLVDQSSCTTRRAIAAQAPAATAAVAVAAMTGPEAKKRSVSAADLLKTIDVIGADASRLHLFVHVYLEYARQHYAIHFPHTVQGMPVFGGWRNAWLEILSIAVVPGVDGRVLHVNLRWHDGSAHPAFITSDGALIMQLICDSEKHGIRTNVAPQTGDGSDANGVPVRRRTVVSVSHSLSAAEIASSSRGPVHGSVKGQNNERKVSHVTGVSSEGLIVCERYDGSLREEILPSRIQHYAPALLSEYYYRCEPRWNGTEAAAILAFVAAFFRRSATNDGAVRAAMKAVAAHAGASLEDTNQMWCKMQSDEDRACNIETLEGLLKSFSSVAAPMQPVWAPAVVSEGRKRSTDDGGCRDVIRSNRTNKDSSSDENIFERCHPQESTMPECGHESKGLPGQSQLPVSASHALLLAQQPYQRATARRTPAAELHPIYGRQEHPRRQNLTNPTNQTEILHGSDSEHYGRSSPMHPSCHHHGVTPAANTPATVVQAQRKSSPVVLPYQHYVHPQRSSSTFSPAQYQTPNHQRSQLNTNSHSSKVVPHTQPTRRGLSLPHALPRSSPPTAPIRKTSTNNSSADMNPGASKNWLPKSKMGKSNKKKCFVCNREGHISYECDRAPSQGSVITSRERALHARLGGPNQVNGFNLSHNPNSKWTGLTRPSSP